MHNKMNINGIGRVLIHDIENGELILEKTNAIHPQNMALIIAKALAHEPTGYISQIALGNGGTYINSLNQISYRPVNIIGTSAALYNETYSINVDENAAGTPLSNSVMATLSPAPATTAMVIVTALIPSDAPNGQALLDNTTTDPDAPFMFDELGLKSSDGLLLTHMVFSPVEKTANRGYMLTYTITVSVS